MRIRYPALLRVNIRRGRMCRCQTAHPNIRNHTNSKSKYKGETTMKKITSLILALVLTFSLVALSACGDKATDDKNTAASDDKSSPSAPAPPRTRDPRADKQALADEGTSSRSSPMTTTSCRTRLWPTAHSTQTTSSISPTSTASTPRTAPTSSPSAPSTMSRSASTATASPT